MSDSMRKGLGDQVSEKVTPDSQKTYAQKASETITGLGDKVAGTIQPEGDKSTTQKMGDATRSGGDDAQAQGQGILASVQQTAGDLANYASETLQSAADALKKQT
ncbi:chaperone shock protein-like protein Hsp12 [Coleophoma cylindrospora]|uniref:Chaperone shock protein-like protein Hsp12 n=1 Tax=Coleophoma cylindrospora TaxID=1849047 RepID=A0A3D8S0T5_9HELO|nr:chaperone shock protein-like protein Hsp12 [Coleophoma cylindrospora]